MKYHSNLSYHSYMTAMKEQMGSFTDFGSERFTGIIIGSFFSVTYHSGYELNRRITNEKHRAIGFVRRQGDSTEISCIRLAGMTNPLSLLGLFASYCIPFIPLFDVEPNPMPLVLTTSTIATVLTALISAICDSLTARGQEGSRVLTAFLNNPTDFYSQVY